MANRSSAFLIAAAVTLGAAVGLRARADGPQFTKTNELVWPAGYREWVFLTSGLGMTYQTPGPEIGAAPNQNFTNVYVNPSAYGRFMQTGHWPEGTILVLESRASSSEGSINKGGHFQTSLGNLEADVLDSRRFPKTRWGYFSFGADAAKTPSAKAQPDTAPCFTCHSQHGAVDQTFVQFYPTLLEVAKRKGTVTAN